MTKTPFPNAQFWLPILTRLEELSDDQISPQTVKLIQNFRKQTDLTDADVWNFLKKLLDFIVHTSGANRFVITTIDVEPHYEPPQGKVYKQADGSISKAPWREDSFNWF